MCVIADHNLIADIEEAMMSCTRCKACPLIEHSRGGNIGTGITEKKVSPLTARGLGLFVITERRVGYRVANVVELVPTAVYRIGHIIFAIRLDHIGCLNDGKSISVHLPGKRLKNGV